jgi:hypothetical protein
MAEPTIKCTKCGTEFPKRQIRCTNCHEIGISKLYRYVRFDVHSLSILIEKKIWFPSAESLNDPFEFDFYCPDMHINGIPIDRTSFEEAKRAMNQMGVLSLSEINNNILMWSHYSDSHKGFCIEFERTDSNEFGNSDHCVPVNYDENLLEIKPLELADSKIVTKILTKKSVLWTYEKEWRIISKTGNQTFDLPGNITGIIFGLKMPIGNCRLVMTILGDTVRYMHATKNLTKFTIDIKPLTLAELK